MDDVPLYGRDGRPMSHDQWARAFEDHDGRVVAKELFDGGVVSTVWLGIDHGFGGGPPLIFETMVFLRGRSSEVYCDRYPTEAAALAGHDQAVAWVRAGMPSRD